MSFNWAEYLSVAEALCGAKVSGPAAGAEAQQRAGVSRAYYAAFASARNRLRDNDRIAVPRTGNAHEFVALHFSTHADSRRRQIGVELGRLRQARNRCDYFDDVPDIEKLSRRSLASAARILTDLGAL